jgi:16S rRNA (cytosine1402-N4)-methyltransferase
MADEAVGTASGRGAIGAGSPTGHVPVMLEEMVEVMAVRPGGIYLDGTFGAGHYSAALLRAGAGRVIGVDRDPAAIAAAAAQPRLDLICARFGDMAEAIGALGLDAVDGIVLDLGVSSMQLDQPARGFSFLADGPLDMRMGGTGPDAADLVNQTDEAMLADIIWRYGEERLARRVARAIVRRRQDRVFRTTSDLAAVVSAAVGRQAGGIHPATRTFQALRIAVNDELGELARALDGAARLLAPEGRLVVVAFHSLEDRLVKQFLSGRPSGGGSSRHRPPTAAAPATFRSLTRRPLRPREDEVRRNPRARSARLRAAERVTAAGRSA